MTFMPRIPVLVVATSISSKHYCYDGFQPYIDAQNTPKLSKNATVAVVKTTVAAVTTEVFVAPTGVVFAPTRVVTKPTRLPLQQPEFTSPQPWLLTHNPWLLSLRPRLSAQQLWHIWLQDSIFTFKRHFILKKYQPQYTHTNFYLRTPKLN